MFITKRHIPRRTFLQGAGITLALPLLEAMVPASTALAQTAATPKPRFVGMFFPHGMAPGYWEPKAEGALPEKLLVYGLGRGLEHQDMPLVRAIARDAAVNGDRFSALVLGVVKSRPFQMNTKTGPAPAANTAALTTANPGRGAN